MRSFGKRCRWISALFVAGCLAATQAGAEPLKPLPAARPSGQNAAAPIAHLGARVDPAVLANLSGGSDVDNTITLNGSVSSTTTENVSTGVNWIGGGAFGNAVGLPMVIQNSGNGVLIQNATIVNLQMQP